MNRLLVLLLFLSLSALADDKTSSSAPTNAQLQSSSNLPLTDKHYTSSDGLSVHSPSKTVSGKAPDGASAQCKDGSYSFSRHRSGTCSHHGGVSTWLQ